MGPGKNSFVDSSQTDMAQVSITCDAFHLPGLLLNPTAGCLPPGALCPDCAAQQEKKRHCFDFQELNFQGQKQPIKFTSPLSPLMHCKKKNQTNKIEGWPGGEILAFFSLFLSPSTLLVPVLGRSVSSPDLSWLAFLWPTSQTG